MATSRLSTRRVEWRVQVGTANKPAQGLVIFEASVSYIPDPLAVGGPRTAIPEPVAAVLDSGGYACTPDPTNPTKAGERGAELFTTDSLGADGGDWTWTARPQLRSVNGIQMANAVPAFSFVVPTGTGNLDLAKVQKVPASPGLGEAQAVALLAQYQRDIGSVVDRANAGEFTGPQGLPGVNAVPAAEAVAEYIKAEGSPVNDAIGAIVDARNIPQLESLRGSAVPDVQSGYLFVTDSATGRRRQVTSGLEVLGGEPDTLGEGVVATINGSRKWISPSGYPRPVATDYARASGWGSSTMQRLGPDLALMFGTQGTTYHHIAGSVGAFQISHIAAAVGIRPLLTRAFTIPAAITPVAITPTNMTEANNTAVNVAWTGSFAGTGIAGNLQTFPGSNEWTFTRSTAGTAKAVPAGTPYIPTRAAEYQAGVTILNPGKNTLTALTPEWTTERVIELTDEMYDFFSGAGRQVLVLGHFVDTNKPLNSITRAPIVQYNNHMRARYGGRFLDVSAYLTGSQVWKDTGVTPTAEDLEQQTLGNKPPSLSADEQHLTQVADEALTRLIQEKLGELGWLNVVPPPPMLTTIADDFNRADGDLGLTSTASQSWKATVGSSTTPKISAQKMMNTETTPRRAVLTPPSGSQDYEISARIAGLGSAPADKNMSIIARATNYNAYVYLAVRAHSGAEGASIWKQSGDTPVLLGTANTSVKSAVGQVWKLKVKGSTLTAYVDGVEVLSVTDATVPTSGDAGLLLGGGTSSACAWDDFSITKI